jgi:GTP-binding protein
MGPQIKVYGGQIIGLHSRDNDLDRQPVEGEEADQHPHDRRRREAVPDPAARVHARVGAGVHQRRRAGRGHADAIRLRKRVLDHNERKRLEKLRDAAAGNPWGA